MPANIFSSLAAGALLLGLSATAHASGPVVISPTLSGSYIVAYTQICQGYLGGSSNGSVETMSVTATFTPSTKKVKLVGKSTSGDLLVPKGFVGDVLFTNAVSTTYSYSNTATTLTINGTVYDIVYGPSSQQITQSFVFSGPDLPHGGSCAVSATATHQ